MGHFGRNAIMVSWLYLAFPCLIINYLGQSALLLQHPASVENPFFLMAPDWARLPLVILATLATIIASQAVISGAYSVSQQAAHLACPARHEPECPPVLYRRLADEGALRRFEESWRHLVEQIRAAGFDVAL